MTTTTSITTMPPTNWSHFPPTMRCSGLRAAFRNWLIPSSCRILTGRAGCRAQGKTKAGPKSLPISARCGTAISLRSCSMTIAAPLRRLARAPFTSTSRWRIGSRRAWRIRRSFTSSMLPGSRRGGPAGTGTSTTRTWSWTGRRWCRLRNATGPAAGSPSMTGSSSRSIGCRAGYRWSSAATSTCRPMDGFCGPGISTCRPTRW